MPTSQIKEADLTKWIYCPAPKPEATLRLLCFPYAGSGPTVFWEWSKSLPQAVEMWGIRPPGRETRLREKAFRQLPPLVETIGEVLRPFLDRPFAVFGHSLGALVGFEVTRYWRRHSDPQPLHLLLSGHRAPHRPPLNPPVYRADDQTFLRRIRNLGGTPQRFFEMSDLVEMMLPSLRADFTCWETYDYQEGAPLDAPITAVGGYDDTEATEEDIAAWRQHTRNDFTYHMFPGGHFYFRPDAEPLLEVVQATLRPYI